MDTFPCPGLCEKLCADSPKPKEMLSLGRYLYYPGLTPEEKSLVEQFPSEALKVFLAKERAEWGCQRIFHRDGVDDESDAFRHFVWAGLLEQDLSSELAKKFLDAHESNLPSNHPSKSMDLANNRAGLLRAKELKKNGMLSQSSLEAAAMTELKNGSLIVLIPRGMPK